jgi:hypothetical protein
MCPLLHIICAPHALHYYLCKRINISLTCRKETSLIKDYNVNEIFSDIDGDDDNILMTIPPEILEKMDWVPGDIIKISQDDNGSITMSKKDVDGKE